MNYYEHHIGDYAAATAHLSLLEDAVYSRLLRRYYLQETALPAEVRQVARLVGARSEDEVEAVQVVLDEFFHLQDDGWHNKRADEEIARYQDKQAKARASAHASVAARREKSEMTNAELRSYRMSEAKKKGRHTKEEWQALVEFCGGKCVRCGESAPLDRDHIVPIYQGGSDSIDNLQPLCARCNSSKGPESADHRPSGWQAFVERSLSERSAHQTPDTNTSTSLRSVDGGRKRAAPIACPDDVDPQTWTDWLALRKAKKAPVTETVLRSARAESTKAGMPLEQFLRVWCARGSQGLQADWLKPHERAGPQSAPNRQPLGKTAQALMALEEFGNGGLDQAGNFGRAEEAHVLGQGAHAGSGGYPADRRRLAGSGH